MCCLFLLLFLVGPRTAMAAWWIIGRSSWDKAWGDISWYVQAAGIIFAPWTSLMFLSLGGEPISGWDWLFLGLGALVDAMSWANFFRSRKDVPQEYQKYIPAQLQ